MCLAAPRQIWFVFSALSHALVCGGSGDRDPPQHVAAGITDHGENEMGTKPARLGPDRVCLFQVCGGDEEQQPAFLLLPCRLLWEHDYMCPSLDGLSARWQWWPKWDNCAVPSSLGKNKKCVCVKRDFDSISKSCNSTQISGGTIQNRAAPIYYQADFSNVLYEQHNKWFPMNYY